MTVGATVAATAAALAPSVPAFAAYDNPTCTTSDRLPHTCTTRVIPAHASQHWLRYRVGVGAVFSIHDNDTGRDAVPPTKSHDFNWHQINNVYGQHYVLRLTSFDGQQIEGTLANCTTGCKGY